MSDVTVPLVTRPFQAIFSPPGSKSLTNRALVVAAMAQGTSRIENILLADDTRVMLEGLRQLGLSLEVSEPDRSVAVHGKGGAIPAASAEISCGNSGTTIRFLTALCALGRGQFTLDGIARMRQRPIGELVQLLRQGGVRVEYRGEPGFPPVVVDADGFPGGIFRFGRAKSSQFLSAILMISPHARHEVSIDLEPGQTSWPYVAMTLRLMDAFGVTAELLRDPATGEPMRLHIPQLNYSARVYAIEPDASNASYFLAAAALHPGSKITITGLGTHSLQGDVKFADVLGRMGANVAYTVDSVTVGGAERLAGIDVDLSDMPDTAQTLAVTAIFAQGKSVLRGLQTLTVKETDRLAALVTELTKLGADASAKNGVLTIIPPPTVRPAEIDTYDDHRMAMSFALAGTRAAGVVIKDAQCVSKTYPDYFKDLASVLAENDL